MFIVYIFFSPQIGRGEAEEIRGGRLSSPLWNVVYGPPTGGQKQFGAFFGFWNLPEPSIYFRCDMWCMDLRPEVRTNLAHFLDSETYLTFNLFPLWNLVHGSEVVEIVLTVFMKPKFWTFFTLLVRIQRWLKSWLVLKLGTFAKHMWIQIRILCLFFTAC